MISTGIKARIYVACLASYNSGILHGAWFDASANVDDMQAAIDAVIESSPVPDAEEWAFHDYEGLGLLHEYQCLDSIAEMVEMYETYCQGPVVAYVSNHGEWNESHFRDSFIGEVEDYPWEIERWLVGQFYLGLHLTGDDLEFFGEWADEAKIARTMAHDYTFVSGENKVAYIFRGC